MEKITVEQVFAEQIKVDALDEEKDKVKEIMTSEIQKVDQDYRDRVWDLEHEKRDKVQKLESARDEFIAGMDAKIAEHYTLVKRVQRVLECFRMETGKNLTIADTVDLNQYAFQYQESLGYLLDDDLLKIKLFIVGNRKPKNRFTLAVIGRSIFGEPLIKFPMGYGLDISSLHVRNSFEQALRDAASAEELKDYVARHRDDILKPVIDEYRQLKAEYVSNLATYQLSDFEKLITWRCPDCNNFKTVYEGDCYRDEPQCYRHDPYVKMGKTLVFATTEKLSNK